MIHGKNKTNRGNIHDTPEMVFSDSYPSNQVLGYSLVIPLRRTDFMSKFTYGLVISVIGMGGTLACLWFITLAIALLKRMFPYREVEEKDVKEVA
jgi:hypothetical protein